MINSASFNAHFALFCFFTAENLKEFQGILPPHAGTHSAKKRKMETLLSLSDLKLLVAGKYR